jgi:hypothetical protein
MDAVERRPEVKMLMDEYVVGVSVIPLHTGRDENFLAEPERGHHPASYTSPDSGQALEPPPPHLCLAAIAV